jgi:hypothetical protein
VTRTVVLSPITSAGLASIVAAIVLGPAALPAAHAAPSPEVAKTCLRYAYRVYPYQRPGAAKASNGRQLYFSDCLAKNGEIPEPPPAKGH